MRRALRPLILLAILLVLGGVGATYYARLKLLSQNSPAKPKKLAPGTAATYHGWTYTHTSNEKTVITVHAEDFQEVEGKQQLTGLELDIYHKDGNQYDRVKSAKAEFDMSQGMLYSEGEVEITMGVPEDAPPSGRLMVIKSSGVRVESKTGKASTDRLASFQFDRGQGKAVGAEYDPNTRELVMHSKVELIWRGSDPKSAPMKVETGEVHYKERDAKVYLSPWSKLTRDTMTLNAGPATVSLNDGLIKLVETTQAHGTDLRPGRNLEYGANQLAIDFNDNNQITKITGADHGRLVATADTAITTLNSDRVTLFFETANSGSVLNTALAEGHSRAESKPVAVPGVEPADTRILKSETINMRMRPNGQEIECIDTPSAAAIEFIPNRAGQPHRWVNGDRVSVAYGERNQIRSFRTVNAATRTEKPKAKDGKDAPPPELTWSKEMLATFQPNSSQLAKLEQWNDFRYEAGERKAKADRALLDQASDAIELTGASRVSDSTGSADADRIFLDQKSGDFSAEGNVSSTRLPDKKPADAGAGGMLAQDEPLHARSKKMRSADRNRHINYEGNAVLWQGANRLQADAVQIDREQNSLNAHGHVQSQLIDKAAEPVNPSEVNRTATNPAARVFTIVKAPELEYNDTQRIAVYTGGVEMERPNMRVKAREIRAFLRTGSDSSLDHTFADGKVEIVQTAPARVRNGASEHAEYYVDEDKVILEGGQPQFTDSLRGTTRGEKLTWFSNDDRLLVNGVENRPAKSVLRRKIK